MKLAQVINLPGGQVITGPLDPAKFTNLASIVNNFVPYLFAIAGVLLLLYLIWGGFDYLTSMGDPKKAEAANKKLTSAIIGIIIIFISYWVVQLAEYLLQI